jgi:hypothetical protein
VRSGTTIRLYVDNSLQATSSAGDNVVANVASLSGFAAGFNQDAMTFGLLFNGAIDDLSIYNQALSFTLSPLGSTCNGFYTGAFKGNVTVNPGQSCIVINGVITGNVMQDGGNLGLNHSQVTGNVQTGGGGTFAIVQSSVGGNVQVKDGGGFTLGQSQVTGGVQIDGAGAFIVGPATTIGDTLQIQNLAVSTNLSQVCGTTVQNDMTYQNSRTAVQIGGLGEPPCGLSGNTIGGNLTIQNNNVTPLFGFSTFAFGNIVGGNLQDSNNAGENFVFFNVVTKKLQCNQNTFISGAFNSASSKQGQCAAF